MNRLGAGIECPLNPQAQEFSIVRSGAHVINIAAVTDFMSLPIRLGFVFVIHAIETPVQIVLVTAPGNTGHHVDPVTARAPRFDALWKSGVDTIDYRYV